MARMQWVKWKDHRGVKYRGVMKYDPPQPWDDWQKILGVVARCEGNLDCFVSYDGTGCTFGFLQWTFTSGRLQKLLESFKSIPYYDFSNDDDADDHRNLFDAACTDLNGVQLFQRYGFQIKHGKIWDLSGGMFLDPRKPAQKNRIVDLCMGRVRHPGNLKQQKQFALSLAKVFAKMGEDLGVAAAQIQFAEAEFKRHLMYNRKPLGGKSIAWLLDTGGPNKEHWQSMLSALFWNLHTNHPAAAYRLFKNAKKQAGADAETYFWAAWKKICLSKFGNWGFGKPTNKSPRVVRIKKAFKEFYGVDLKYYKP